MAVQHQTEAELVNRARNQLLQSPVINVIYVFNPLFGFLVRDSPRIYRPAVCRNLMDNPQPVTRTLLVEADILARIVEKHIRIQFHLGTVHVNKAAADVKLNRGDSPVAYCRLQKVVNQNVLVFAQRHHVMPDRAQKFLRKNGAAMRNGQDKRILQLVRVKFVHHLKFVVIDPEIYVFAHFFSLLS